MVSGFINSAYELEFISRVKRQTLHCVQPVGITGAVVGGGQDAASNAVGASGVGDAVSTRLARTPLWTFKPHLALPIAKTHGDGTTPSATANEGDAAAVERMMREVRGVKLILKRRIRGKRPPEALQGARTPMRTPAGATLMARPAAAGKAVPARVLRGPLGCSKCRYLPKGCARCRSASFRARVR